MELKSNNEKFIKQLEKRAKDKLIKRYDKPVSYHDIKIINDILFNQKNHYVEMFKEFLLYEDYNEFLKKYYGKNVIRTKLPKILMFYEKYSKIFANYTVIPESKYMYKNIKRKQKVIDQINNNNYKKYSGSDEEYSNSEYYSNTIFNQEILNSIYNKSKSSIKNNILNLTISKSTINRSLNNLISQITKNEKEKEKEKSKTKAKKLNDDNNLKNISYSSVHKKTKEIINNLNKENKFNNIKKNIEEPNPNKNYFKNIEINNNSNNIIIYNYNYNMNSNINSYSNKDAFQNNSMNINKANINNKKQMKSNIDKAKQKIISTLMRQGNDLKKIEKIINYTNKNNNTSNNYNYFKDKDGKKNENLRDNIMSKCEKFILSTNYLDSSKSINNKNNPSKSFLKKKVDMTSSKRINSKNNKSNIPGYFSNRLKKKHKINHYQNNVLLKYQKKISKTTKNKKLRKTNKFQFQKEKCINNKNLKRPESHRNYHYSKELSSENPKNKLNIKKRCNNSKIINYEEKNILKSYYYNEKKKEYNGSKKPYNINSFFSYSNLNSPINSLKNSPFYYSYKEINENKKFSFYSKSKEKNNLSISKSKKSIAKIIKFNQSRYDLINKKFVDKTNLIQSERQNKSKKFKTFFKNNIEKQLSSKEIGERSFVENSINNKIINKDRSLSKIIQGSNITPIKNKFNSKIKIKSKEKKNKIKNYKNSNNNFTLFNKIKQSQKVIIKPNIIINNFNEVTNSHSNKILILSERYNNKKIFSKK